LGVVAFSRAVAAAAAGLVGYPLSTDPVEYQGRQLVDGGLLNNLPIWN
jgi:predicted acylesterase/phospholipase RssA